MTATFGIFGFGDEDSGIAYMGGGPGLVWLEREAQVVEAQTRFARLASAALSRAESLEVIVQRTDTLARG